MSDRASTLQGSRTAGLPCSVQGNATQRRAERVGETHVSDQPISVERGRASPGSIEELVGDQQVHRFVLVLETADRAGGKDVLDAEGLESEDVRAEVQFRWRETMAGSVARQERDS